MGTQRGARRPELLAQHVFQCGQLSCPADRFERDGRRDGGARCDQIGGIVGRSGVVAAQCGDDVDERLTGIAVVDPLPLGE